MRLAIGTSLAIITATSALALVTHLLTGRGLDVPVTTAMTAASVAGAVAGTSLAGRVPQRQLAHGFATMVAAVAGYLLISAAFLGGPPGDLDGLHRVPALQRQGALGPHPRSQGGDDRRCGALRAGDLSPRPA
jgi:hypothetical protein